MVVLDGGTFIKAIAIGRVAAGGKRGSASGVDV